MGRFLCMVLCGCLAVSCLIGGVYAADDGCKSEAKAQVSGKIVIIGPDGKKQEFDLDLGKAKGGGQSFGVQVQLIDGKLTVVGPDGKKKEIDPGSSKKGGHLPKDVHQQVQKALERHMGDLPKPQAASQHNLERQIKQLQQQNKRLAEQLKRLRKDIEELKSK